MTDPLDEYGELLRRALHAEADSVMPAPDGLERIRERIGGHGRLVPGGVDGRSWRLGWSWLTESWTRPLLAAGAAGFVALMAVSAPPAIHGFTSAGDRGPAQHDKPRPSGSLGRTQDGRQNQPNPGVQPSPHVTVAVTPTPSAVTGTPTCAVTSPTAGAPTPSARVTPQVTPGRSVSASPTCPAPPVTATPTPVPSTPVISPTVTPTELTPTDSAAPPSAP
jgi:hypothetical protein